MTSQPLFGSTGGQTPFARFIDHAETYGPRVIDRLIRQLPRVSSAVDLGAGTGRDLQLVKRAHPSARLTAIEAGHEYARELSSRTDFDQLDVQVSNIERDPLPFADESIDLIIANQVLEHTKEIFWIFHEVTRSLRIKGHFLIGVPNIASLHNRILLLAGHHPTQHKLCSAHVRPFSKRDTVRFAEACFPGGYSLVNFAGSQFYPFPTALARPLARIFPTAAFSIFFLFRKELRYVDGFATYPSRAHLETNFWAGERTTGSQYQEAGILDG